MWAALRNAAAVAFDERRARHDGARQIHDHRQRLVADLDRLDGILRLGRTGGDHRGDRFADVPHNVDGERMSRRCRRRRAVGTAEIGRQCQRIHAGAHELLAGDDGEHAGQRGRGRRVDRDDAGVRVRRAQDCEVQFPGGVDVIGKTPLANEEGLVFDATDGLAAAKARKLRRQFRHCNILPCRPGFEGIGGVLRC